MTWLIRGILGIGIVVLAVLALTAHTTPSDPPAPALTTAAVAAPPPTAVPVPTPVATYTTVPFVEHVVSRVARDTQVPFPTSTPLPQGIGFVNVVDYDFLPNVVHIKVGEDVTWTNSGQELHDVNGDDGWASGIIQPTTSYNHVFGFAGTFDYRCSVHSDMHGTVVVSP